MGWSYSPDAILHSINESSSNWDDLRFPATIFNPQGAVSDPDWDPTNLGYIMADGTVIYFIAQMSHSKKLGTDIKPHIHWEQTAAGNVHWRIEYMWYKNGEIVPSSYTTIDTTTQVFDYTSGTIAQISSFPAITPPTDETVSSMMKIRILRIDDVDDTYTGDPVLSEFDIHYEVDSLGSQDEYSKYD